MDKRSQRTKEEKNNLTREEMVYTIYTQGGQFSRIKVGIVSIWRAPG